MKPFVTVCSLALLLCLLTSSFAAAQPSPPPNYAISSFDNELQNEEQIFFDPTDSTKLVAVWRDFRLGYRQIGIGTNFAPFYNVWFDHLIPPVQQVFGLRSWQSDPTLTVDAAGNFYISVLDFRPIAADDSSHIAFYKSTDQGATWTGPFTVIDTVGPYFEDKQFIACDRTGSPYAGNVYVAWARFPNPTRMQFARSIDGGLTFEDTVNFGPPLDIPECGYTNLDAGQFAFPAVGSDGAVYIFWNSLLADDDCNLYRSISMVKSTDGGVTFTPKQDVIRTVGSYSQVDGSVDVYNAPILDFDITGGPFDNYLYMAYANADTLSPNFDFNVEFRRSTDGGATWSDEQYINDDGDPLFDQFHPWLFVNQEGLITCIWYDQRTDPINHTKFDLYAAYSFDGGESWTTNHRISDASVDPGFLRVVPGQQVLNSPSLQPTQLTLAPQAGRIAEYIGVTSYRDLHHAAWTDTRNGSQDVFGANWTTPFMKPRLISPINNDTVYVDTPQLRWASAWKTDEDSYTVEVYNDPGFSSLVYSSSTDTTFDVTSALPSTGKYYWLVKATRIPDAVETAWSNPDSFNYVAPGCCVGQRGDINGDSIDADPVDLSYLVDYLFSSGPGPVCDEEADLNADSLPADPVDLSYLVDFLFSSGPAPAACP